MRPALRDRYLWELQQLPERARVEQLTRWGESAPDRAMTQKELMRLWKLTQGAVSTALACFIERRFVVALPRQGAGPTEYELSGTSRRIFPAAAKPSRVSEGRTKKRSRS